MPSNYVLLEKITVGAAGASSVTFSGIPQTGYTDLVIKASCRSTWNGSTSAVALQFNNDSASNYSYRRLYGTGAGKGSDSTTSTKLLMGYLTGSNQTANTFGTTEIYIPNYTSLAKKSASSDSLNEDNSTTAFSSLVAGLWLGTAAITSITLVPWDTPADWVNGTTFYLYGVAALGTTPVITPYATGGDTIMTDGTYWYHAFLSSGTFTPSRGLSCDVLVVAGGGGGGRSGGGGGAGGVLPLTSQSLIQQNYTVTVGLGGAGNNTDGSFGGVGGNSVFNSSTAIGGGGGGSYSSLGQTGGSGGGGGTQDGTVRAGGSGTSSQGFAGGSGSGGAGAGRSSGGGGGASAAGGTATSGTGGNGGTGLSTWSSWLSATGTGVGGYIAGGGGGSGATTAGTAGQGGGGSGGNNGSTAPTNGVANTGGGGGGQKDTTGANGGSGLVLVRYPV